MASRLKQLGEELTCVVCMEEFADPVTLGCGHNFCQGCIERCWEAEEGAGAAPSCPQCRRRFSARPSLQKNTVLANVVKQLALRDCFDDNPPPMLHRNHHQQQQKPQQQPQCALCLPQMRAAVRSCFTCDLSFCAEHSLPHSTAAYGHHAVVEPAVDVAARKCSEHGERLRYVCRQDGALVCIDCTTVGAHRNHAAVRVEQEDPVLKKALMDKLDALQRKIKAIRDNKLEFSARDRDMKTAFTAHAGKVEGRQKDVKAFLEREAKAAKQVLSSEQAKALQKTKQDADRLDARLAEIQALEAAARQLLQTTDSLSFVQEYPIHSQRIDAALAQIPDKVEPPALDERGITEHLAWLDSIFAQMDKMQKTRNLYPWRMFNKRKLVMDVSTAHPNLLISKDFHMATYSEEVQDYPDNAQRFECVLQVLCSESFSSGQHYWEVYVKCGAQWEVGVAYGSIGRKRHNERNVLGNNSVSWCFSLANGEFSGWHNGNKVVVDVRQPLEVLGVHLDYEAGTIAFYNAQSMALLHSFTGSFAQPLYPAFGVYPASSLALCDFGLLF